MNRLKQNVPEVEGKQLSILSDIEKQLDQASVYGALEKVSRYASYVQTMGRVGVNLPAPSPDQIKRFKEKYNQAVSVASYEGLVHTVMSAFGSVEVTKEGFAGHCSGKVLAEAQLYRWMEKVFHFSDPDLTHAVLESIVSSVAKAQIECGLPATIKTDDLAHISSEALIRRLPLKEDQPAQVLKAWGIVVAQ
jgi:hypothetical protein